VRRYGGPLRRYAATIVGGKAEDVTQDAFSKALQALRRDESEIELRPWLFRIVRNTALNDLRDRPPSALVLAEAIEGHRGVAEEVERREEVAELLERLRALPEAQRAAIVMRELEGLGHDEIATALGISGGAARQAIHRARTALRNGLGMAIPIPLLKLMLEGIGSPPAEIAAGGAGAGVVLKAATATVLVVGTFGAGVALHETRGGRLHSPGSASRQSNSSASSPALASTATVTRRHGSGRDVVPQGDRASHGGRGGPSGNRSGGDLSRDGSGGEQGTSGHHGSTSGHGEGGHHSAPSLPESSGHGGGTRVDSRSDGGQNSGSSDGSPASGDSLGDGGSSSGSSDGGSSGSGDLSGSGDGSGSSSGPGSGGEEASGSGSGDSRDSQSGDGFSVQMESLPLED
jgi:RNA polymerase sigma factor (sigma-70 family)